jgi:hypothetical protein
VRQHPSPNKKYSNFGSRLGGAVGIGREVGSGVGVLGEAVGASVVGACGFMKILQTLLSVTSGEPHELAVAHFNWLAVNW